MKRITLTSILTLFAVITAFANGPRNDSIRYYASKLGQNWFIAANGSVNWWQGTDRIPAGNFTTLNGPTFGGGVSFGKWITHNLAIRAAYDINRAHSFINGRHINNTTINFLYNNSPAPTTVVQDGVSYDYYQTSFMYHNMHLDVLLSPVDLFTGYYSDRFYTPVLFLGMGVACVSEHFFVLPSVLNKEGRNFELSAVAGLMNNFRMNDNFDLNITLQMSGQEWHIDTWYNEYGADLTGKLRPRFADFNYQASLGVIWYPTRRIYELPINYSNEMREVRERIKYLESLPTVTETEIIHDTLVQFIQVQVGDTVTEIVSFPLSVFFNKGSYQLMSSRDLVNLREIANVALKNGWKIRLRGSCDSATASAEFNQRLSENRCRKVKMELMDMGVPEEQFLLVPVGGVKELNPAELDRRVLIELVKEIK